MLKVWLQKREQFSFVYTRYVRVAVKHSESLAKRWPISALSSPIEPMLELYPSILRQHLFSSIAMALSCPFLLRNIGICAENTFRKLPVRRNGNGAVVAEGAFRLPTANQMFRMFGHMLNLDRTRPSLPYMAKPGDLMASENAEMCSVNSRTWIKVLWDRKGR